MKFLPSDPKAIGSIPNTGSVLLATRNQTQQNASCVRVWKFTTLENSYAFYSTRVKFVIHIQNMVAIVDTILISFKVILKVLMGSLWSCLFTMSLTFPWIEDGWDFCFKRLVSWGKEEVKLNGKHSTFCLSQCNKSF